MEDNHCADLDYLSQEEDPLTEGVRSQVVFVVVVIVTFLAGLLTLLRRQKQKNIHPENQEHVRVVPQQLQTEPDEDSEAESKQQNYTDMSCPVCLQQAVLPLETNCGHIFCGSCIIALWRYNTWLGAINCPICRQIVTLLLPLFHERASPQRVQDGEAEPQLILRDVNDYNRRFSGQPRSFMERLRDVPTLLRHTFRERFSVGLFWMIRTQESLFHFGLTLTLGLALGIIPYTLFMYNLAVLLLVFVCICIYGEREVM